MDGCTKTTIHILNRVPSKAVPKIPYELWTGRKPTLNYLHVWGCPAEAKVFNPTQKKLDDKTVSYHFIGYPERSKGFRFYCPDRYTKFVEMRHTMFLEDEMVRGSRIPREIALEEKKVCAPMPMIQEPHFSVHVLMVPIVHMTPTSTVQATVDTVSVVDFGSSRMTAEGRDAYEPSIHATPKLVHVEQPVINEVPPRQPIVYIRRS
jgi:hypothetical protein